MLRAHCLCVTRLKWWIISWTFAPLFWNEIHTYLVNGIIWMLQWFLWEEPKRWIDGRKYEEITLTDTLYLRCVIASLSYGSKYTKFDIQNQCEIKWATLTEYFQLNDLNILDIFFHQINYDKYCNGIIQLNYVCQSIFLFI